MSEQKKEPVHTPGPYGMLAEYASDTDLIAAAEKVRDEGFERWDCYSPFPVHGIDPAMGIKRTRLPFIVLCAGLTGTTTAVVLQWWTNAVDYQYIISGKPLWSIPANVPIAFELTVLFSALTTFISMLLLNGLPKPSSPLDRVRRFARASDDRFFVVIESSDPKYDPAQTKQLLESTQPLAIETVPADTSSDRLPMPIVYGVLGMAALALVPFGLFAAAREAHPTKPQFHIVPNMDFQTYYKPQRANEFFADGRAEREPVEGTVAVGNLRDDEHLYEGKAQGTWALALPPGVPANEATMVRGEERFGIHCAPCHGVDGSGDGIVHRRAFALKEGTWVVPTNLADPKVVAQPVGQLFNTISHGIRNMPGYALQITPEDRWAILLYVRALQKSRLSVVAAVEQPKAE
jgi:mono/diheme cytochrome c family protein